MAVIYNKNINSMSCYPYYDNKHNVVFSVQWTMSGTDGIYNASYSTSIDIEYNADSFTPYNELTQEQVLDWVMSATSPEYIANMESSIAKQIEDQQTPAVVSHPLPWNTPAADIEPTIPN